MSSELAASTVTPGRTAPDVSLTTPVITDPCAYAAVGTIGRHARMMIPLMVNFLMLNPLANLGMVTPFRFILRRTHANGRPDGQATDPPDADRSRNEISCDR